MILKRNIWLIFYFLLLVSVIIYVLLLYFKYYDIKDRHLLSYNYNVDILAKSTDALFSQEGMLLDVLGNQLLLKHNHNNDKENKKLLDRLLKRDKSVIGLGLADVNGNLLLTSSSVNSIKNMNLLTNKLTEDSFVEALNSENMVVGRTYFIKKLGEWITPIRKAIKDNSGNTIGVMTAGLRHNSEFSFLNNLSSTKKISFIIIKENYKKNNFYKIYDTNIEKKELDALYSNPIPRNIVELSLKSIKKASGLSIKKLKDTNSVVTFETKSTNGRNIIASVVYSEKYKLFYLVQNNQDSILNDFIRVFIDYTLIFIASFILIYLLFRNIAKLEKRKNEELVFQTMHDSLTDLPNRTYMYKNISNWNKNNSRSCYSVLYIDLDNFKNINDKFGHIIGDNILVEVSQRLQEFFVDNEMIIRQGGDEFIILKECIDDAYENKLSELINYISRTYNVDNKEFRVGMSMGIAMYPKDALNIDELLSLADTAMYEAKKVKNSYCFFSESMRHNNIVKTDIENELRSAVEKNELYMVYQPQINSDGSLHGVEALVRWENDKLGVVGPDKFIPVAEVTGLMKEFGEFITTTSLRDIKRIQNELGLLFRLSINISVVQLMEADFLEKFLIYVKNENYQKDMLTLEITESLSIEDLDQVLPLLYSIREHDIEISLDDFGTGYSSLGILKKLPITELKIDKSFIDEILYDKSERALVQSIINIGKNFKMKTLAEGVETLEQVQILKENNCDVFQGYYYSKPLNYDNLVEYLKQKK